MVAILSFFIYQLFSALHLLLFLAVVSVLLIMLLLVHIAFAKEKITKPPITKLVMASSSGVNEKEWLLGGRENFLIGKSSLKTTVDIELADASYAKYISQEHALLSFERGRWYIKDLGSANGVGIKRKGEDIAWKIKPHRPYQLNLGDSIFISQNVKLHAE